MVKFTLLNSTKVSDVVLEFDITIDQLRSYQTNFCKLFCTKMKKI